ncbi:MAG: aminotransferase class V-fold PLP-dependent enzyme, partial [Hyphomonadaceae bacterium]|nr:aminotransferase class V-fold PLP-dependent enzyme [Hyphomonadaceae bacterium]
MTDRLYLDHNASSPARPETIAAMNEALKTGGNPTAPHGNGRAAHKFVADGREAVALAMGVCAQDVIFTGCGTESINAAIHSAVVAGCSPIYVSSLDHPASILAAEASGSDVRTIPALADGYVDLDWLADQLSGLSADQRPFVSIVAVNSETGVVQDIERATELSHAAGGIILVDAVQAMGKVPMTFIVDYLAVSAHKIGGPQGVGALYVDPEAPFTSLLHGGGQEKRRRAGTLNAAGIAGFGAAAKVADAGMDHLSDIRDAIEAGLKEMEPDLVIFGEGSNRIPNTSFFAVPDTASQTLMMALDLDGISVSTGTACSSGKVGASRAVTAMGLADKAPHGCIRL